MKVAVIGGKLQGIETCYLARRAGWEVTLIDRDPLAPARGLCNAFVCKDIVGEPGKLIRVIRDVDLIIPAMEDLEALGCLAETAARSGIPLVLDPDAYAITSSKKRSDRLFSRLGIPAPRPWPRCGPPVIVKPVESSGSRGVKRIADREGLGLFLQRIKPDSEQWVIQEYLEGPSYSLEVMGLNGQSVTLQPTALEMDSTFDCKRVLAPVALPAALDQEFRAMATCLAQTLRLNGIMDLEVIHHENHLKILEIDARLPSQTPTAVERSTDINMLELLREVFLDSRLPEVCTTTERGVVYEHIRVLGNRLEVSGEHIMAQADALHVEDGFFGADTAITNFSSPDRPWVATLIVSGPNRDRAWEKRCRIIRAIMEACELSLYEDSVPDDSVVSGGGPE